MRGITFCILAVGIAILFLMCRQSPQDDSLITKTDTELPYPPPDSTLPQILRGADSLIQWRNYSGSRRVLENFFADSSSQPVLLLNRAKNMWCYALIRDSQIDPLPAYQMLRNLEMTGGREDTLILGQRAINLGFYYQTEPDSALKYFDQALAYVNAYYPWDDPAMQRYYSDIGSFYFFDGYRTLEALNLVQKEEILHKSWRYSPFARYVLFYNLGAIHRELEDFDLAERYTLQAVSELRTNGMDTLTNIVFPYASLCYMYAEKNDLTRLNHYVDTTLAFVNRFYQHNLSERLDYYSMLALCYGPGYVNKPERGLAILDSVPAYSPDLLEYTTSYAQVHRSKAYLYSGMGNLTKAQQFMKKAIALFEVEEDLDLFYVSIYADALVGLGIFYLEDGNRVEEAMPYIRKASEIMFGASLEDVVHSLDIRYLKYYDRWFDYYVAYGDYLLWKSDPTLVSDILRLSARIDSAIVTTRQKVSDQDVLRNARLNHDIYTYMIGWYDKINKQKPDEASLRQAFDCFEKSKGHMLLTQLSNKTLAAQLSVPDAVIEKGVELTRTETTTSLAVSDPTEMNAILDQKQEYFEMLREKYPEYYEKSYQPDRTDLAEVLDVLGDEEALLSYQLKDSQLYVMVITQETLHLERLQFTSLCADAIDALNTLVRTRPSHTWNENDIRYYTQTAQQIFRCVLSKAYPLIDKKKQWWIAADGILELLPFEILLDEQPFDPKEFQSLPYLVRRYDIGYVLSATTWVRERKQADLLITDVAVFIHSDGLHTVRSSGIERDFSVFQGMPGTAKAAASIREVFGKSNVSIHANRDATISAFLQTLNTYDVLHLGLHAYADTTGRQRHGIVFPGDASVLTISDIIGKEIHASVIFLEGCETGVGKQARGEGTLNFARPFIAAGARHVLASRWKLDDQTAGEMSGYFYQQLKAGQNVAAANCEAKRMFLQNVRRLQSHPYYWAAVMSVQ